MVSSVLRANRVKGKQLADLAINRIEAIRGQLTAALLETDPIQYRTIKGHLDTEIIRSRQAVVNLGLIKWHEGTARANKALAHVAELERNEANRKTYASIGADPKRIKAIQTEPKPAHWIEAEQEAQAAVKDMNGIQADLLKLSAILGELAPDGTIMTEEFEKAILEFKVDKYGAPIPA